MNNKKEFAIVLGATGNLTFALANVLIGIKKHSPQLETDIVIFHKDIKQKDQDLINNIFPCQFIEYSMPINTSGVEKSSFSRYSELAFSRYECFNMLDEYKKVLWLDVDILIQNDISGILEFAKSGLALYQENTSLQCCFHEHINGFDMNGNHYNSGVLLLDDSLPDYNKMTQWLYDKTYEIAEHLAYADQGVINILLQHFNIDVCKLDEEYNCHPIKKNVKNANIIHSYAPQKFWHWYEKIYNFKEWDNNYKKWIKIGGAPYSGDRLSVLGKWAKCAINPEAPDPLRHTRFFFRFIWAMILKL